MCAVIGVVRYWVVFNDYDAIKEAHVDRGSDFMDRDYGYPSIWNYINYEDGMVFLSFDSVIYAYI